jgi:hypothetical protein
VKILHFWNSTIPKFPNNLGEVFKNITQLMIQNSKLREISKEILKQFLKLEDLDLSNNQLEEMPKDLFEFNKKLKIIILSSNKIQKIESGLLDELQNLKEFYIGWNQLEFVPGDFLKFNKKMKRIFFYGNKIKFIGPELLDELPELTYMDFTENICINNFYNNSWHDLQKLNEIKQEIKSLKIPPELREEIEKSKVTKKPEKSERKSSNNQSEDSSKNCKEFHKELETLLTLDDFKDFTIKINTKVFKVHKFLFIARSETFAELMKQNPAADELILEDIPVEIFEVILKFLYTDEAPKDPKNAREIFSAASKLKIKKLKEIYAKILIEKVESEKNFEELWKIFNLGVKFES